MKRLKEIKIPLIKDGTVIDHITAGNAVKAVKVPSFAFAVGKGRVSILTARDARSTTNGRCFAISIPSES